jgi:DNA polymerase III delta subunit
MIRMLLNLLDFFKELINQKLKVSAGKFMRNKIILKNLNIYGRNFSAQQILNAIVLLRDCDLIIKTTSINEKYFFYSILVEVCEGNGD